MDLAELETKLRSLLDGEYTSIHIEFNEHSSDYETAANAVQDMDDQDIGRWVSEEEKQKAIATNSIWRMQWYPNTPVGFCALMASSLEAVVNTALKVE